MAPVPSIAALLSRWRSAFSNSEREQPDPRAELGRRGEKLAVRFLRANGYKILYRNFRSWGVGEIDIICREKKQKPGTRELVFVEVKTRSSTEYGDALYAVKHAQQRRISRGAIAWMKMLGSPKDVTFRFDIVEVLVEKSGVKISVIRDAFQLSEPYIY